jgi:hypothetical protein
VPYPDDSYIEGVVGRLKQHRRISNLLALVREIDETDEKTVKRLIRVLHRDRDCCRCCVCVE